MVLENLEPKIVWDIFENILTKTPRCSKKEEKIRGAIKDWVSKHDGLSVTEDGIGNLVIKKPATCGMESCPPLLFQVHMDMVCETDRSEGFDFDNAPIPVRITNDGEWIDADGTTLGADDGIGVALSLALLVDDSVKHGPLEVLITVDEETGLTGAFGLETDVHNIQSRLMVNIDSEELGAMTIGSAGGGSVILERNLSFTSPKGDLFFVELKVSGLLGGHSGLDIHRPRGNANKIVARLLARLSRDIDVFISDWNGGTKRNAITRESIAVIAVKSDSKSKLEEILTEERDLYLTYYKNPLGPLEPDMVIEWGEAKHRDILSLEDSKTIIMTTNAIPHGVKRFTPSIPDLTETSCNFGVIRTDNEKMIFHLSNRSSVASELDILRDSLVDIGKLGGWRVDKGDTYPGWKPEPKNEFLQFVKKNYEAVFGTEVKLEALHGGLETGVIGDKIPGISMVSIGVTMKDVHTPDERLNIASVGTVYKVLKKLVSELPSFNPKG